MKEQLFSSWTSHLLTLSLMAEPMTMGKAWSIKGRTKQNQAAQSATAKQQPY